MLSLLIFIFIFIEGVKATTLIEFRCLFFFFFFFLRKNKISGILMEQSRESTLEGMLSTLTVSQAHYIFFFYLDSPAAYFSSIRLKIT